MSKKGDHKQISEQLYLRLQSLKITQIDGTGSNQIFTIYTHYGVAPYTKMEIIFTPYSNIYHTLRPAY